MLFQFQAESINLSICISHIRLLITDGSNQKDHWKGQMRDGSKDRFRHSEIFEIKMSASCAIA